MDKEYACLLGSAVARAMEDAEVFAPGTHGVAVLVGHQPGELMKMRQVVDDPSGQKLRHGDDAESRMASAAREVLGPQIQSAQFGKIL